MSPKLLRVLLLLALLAALAAVGAALGVDELLTIEWIRANMVAAGVCGLAFFIACFAIGNLMQVPGMLFVAAAIVVYGKVMGAGVALGGALVAVSVSFWFARLVGGRPLGDIANPRVARILKRLEDRPIQTVVLLRTVTAMSPPVNYTLALSNVRYRDYLVGSILGLVGPIALATILFEALLVPYLA